MSTADVAKMVNTHLERGLSMDEVAARHKKDGLNKVSPPREVPLFIRFFMTWFQGFAPVSTSSCG
jgi:hypothetical protein